MELDYNKIPNRKYVVRFIKYTKNSLFPGFFSEVKEEKKDNREMKRYFKLGISNDEKVYQEFISKLHKVREDLNKDIEFFYISDPACHSNEIVVSSYPGFNSILYYRVAHIILELGYEIAARMISEEAHSLWGVDINPGAKIDSPFFIDHATGVVIGETAIIGKNVRIYQGVTLGALSPAKGQELKGVKRHPTIEDNVTIYSGASILGDVTIGKNVVIGGNVFIADKSISANTRVSLDDPKLVIINNK
ncbi:MAG: serine O-acetyltransferase [Coprobacillus sp.]|nr:serine O-acetyltransferase [Coprobacillus sp.]